MLGIGFHDWMWVRKYMHIAGARRIVNLNFFETITANTETRTSNRYMYFILKS